MSETAAEIRGRIRVMEQLAKESGDVGEFLEIQESIREALAELDAIEVPASDSDIVREIRAALPSNKQTEQTMPTIEQVHAARTADKLQRPEAIQYMQRILRRVLVSVAPEVWREASDDRVRDRLRIMVATAQAGTMDDHDSRVMGELGLAIARDLAKG